MYLQTYIILIIPVTLKIIAATILALYLTRTLVPVSTPTTIPVPP
jgi:hypothetical protein